MIRSAQDIVNKFIIVPNHVLADEDKLQRTQYTNVEFVDIRKKLEELQQRAKRVCIIITCILCLSENNLTVFIHIASVCIRIF